MTKETITEGLSALVNLKTTLGALAGGALVLVAFSSLPKKVESNTKRIEKIEARTDSIIYDIRDLHKDLSQLKRISCMPLTIEQRGLVECP